MHLLPRRAFGARRLVASLNVVAVGAALAAITSAAFGLLHGDVQLPAAISTFATGTIWAAALRAPAAAGSRMRLGWFLSPILACANSMLCLALVMLGEHPPSPLDFLGMVILGGAFFGAIVWVPALMLTLLLFGLPIARAQSLASRGLAGADRGEIIVGVTTTLLALASLGLAAPSIHVLPALVGAACGVSATVLAALRERARRAFVRSVEAGAVANFRVEPTPEGKVLLRVTTTGAAYRVSDFAEEIATLSPHGEVLRYAGTINGDER